MHTIDMKSVCIHKCVGETPLVALERYRREQGIAPETKMAYAGRLDPMAEGALLVLIGEECKNLKAHCGLDKEYEVEILLGMSTDTGDVLGLTNECTRGALVHSLVKIEIALDNLTGKYEWEYPVFSSKTVGGKPLFMYYYEGALDTITVPKATGEIYALELQGVRTISGMELLKYVQEKIALLPKVREQSKERGRDFRREEILARWHTVLATNRQGDTLTELSVVRVRCACSSGTYMRTLAHKVGEALGTEAFALSIKRTKIGDISNVKK